MNRNFDMNSTIYKSVHSMNGNSTPEPENRTADISNNIEDRIYFSTTTGFDVYYYPGYSFERPIYQVIWEVMVITTTLINILVIVVLLRKNMRNPTNMILTAISFSDTLTGVVTLPTYIMVYQQFEPAQMNDQRGNGDELEITTVSVSNASTQGYNIYADYMYESNDAYALSESLCTWFMLTKFFFSKTFHTMSIFLTLFLGFQRFVCVAYPFLSEKFFTNKSTIVTCVLIIMLSPVLHIYHVVKEKAEEGMCEWKLENCEGDCAFLWIVLIFRHLIPCTLLTVCTVMFVRELRKSRMVGGNRKQMARRERENRRVTTIVVAIVIVFLIPEIPYGVFLFVSVISKHTNTKPDLEKIRAIHAIYELTLVTSFQANFYIYTIMNKRFREGLKRSILYCAKSLLGRPYQWSVSRSQSERSEQRRTFHSTTYSKNGTLLRHMNPDYVGKTLKEEPFLTKTKLANDAGVPGDFKYE
ncbi:uncharacterized protein LOC128245506 [Mya arenaria]|uniref:uncharacterized protein LOC128245506 n=1 Tax=Mya arenaria TaxID=6604 RepID=UPI0022E4D292|nr:uncharacterized protein LOC128245506 [Mya arenaria]XP_052819650.1 uncharacterized protein LOC128245506 [Mya arenaria]XP_052819651.1 uncharacterized protein LOC128245506 [Mya arenaria]XP_052819652.1 uncharacterized protein LOC128245506 [Mya arenaria]XP_052819654.1 uncharacterized protein LOC128245506 [Mya arenaria]XP_052819655.1 uncharacterized protein LOC128245506 [Mya arenaria]XP_052819656.1 uncharacterized protein LOC128245506 [Mya arenaria]XP_052819657.1 uncharacterized protein LOC1282